MEPMKLDIQMFATPDPVLQADCHFRFINVSNPPAQTDITFYRETDSTIVTVDFTNGEFEGKCFIGFPIKKIIVGDGTLYSATWVENLSETLDVYIYPKNTITGKILGDNVDNITAYSTYSSVSNNNRPNFSNAATTDEGMFTDFDNDGVTTYFRGAVTNNYVKFANFWWRIIRVNGNGSIRLIYDGTTAHANGESSTDRHTGTSAFNTNNNDNAYVGYMYGTPGSTTYEATHANVNDSSIKTTLDNWYESNLSNYSDYIDTEAGFCGDRTPYRGSGAGTTRTYYAANNRVVNNKQPTFECSNSSDLYTTSGSSQGNKALQYPIGLISADEVAYAGGVWTTSNTSYYLYTNSAYWTMSPYWYNGSAVVFGVNTNGYLGSWSVDFALGVRPVINLRGDLSVTGTGTSTDPYEVSLPVVPTITIFNGTELTNIYYNGTEISKMYCNGVLVFEKGPTVYKRRIMVGDVFDSNSRIFSDIPDNFINEELPNMGVVDPKQTIITGSNFNIGELYIAGFYRVYIDYDEIQDDGSGYDEQFYVYDVYSYGTMLNIKDIPLDKLTTSGVITSVNENVTYRHLYIEDTNIRPLQVGDKLVNKTKLYFVFPDDCYEKIKSSEYIVKINTITNEELGIITYCSASSQEINIGKITYDPNKVVNNGTTIYVWVDMLGQLYKNTSFNLVKDLSLDGLQFIGTVSEINSNSEIYNYILVDTTTLG